MTGSLQIKSGKYYAVLNFRAEDGSRAQKWINLGLDARGNKRRAEAELNRRLVEYQGIDHVEPMNTLLSVHIRTWLAYNSPTSKRPHTTSTSTCSTTTSPPTLTLAP